MTEASVPALGLAQRLRAETRDAHVDAESALDLDSALLSLRAYAAMLLSLHLFYTAAEERLMRVPGWDELHPAVDPVERQRAYLLVRDLERLGMTSTSRPGTSAAPPEPDTMAAALGCLYVIEGSRLGGRVIARQVRRRLGDQAPVSFFSGDGQLRSRDWHTLQRALDFFGAAAGETAAATTVAAARDTFAAFAGCLSGRMQPS